MSSPVEKKTNAKAEGMELTEHAVSVNPFWGENLLELSLHCDVSVNIFSLIFETGCFVRAVSRTLFLCFVFVSSFSPLNSQCSHDGDLVSDIICKLHFHHINLSESI